MQLQYGDNDGPPLEAIYVQARKIRVTDNKINESPQS
jgi:hypothetical protein